MSKHSNTYILKKIIKTKNRSLTPKFQWKILKRSTTPSCFDGRCNLCLEEKIQIILYFDLVNLLNQRCDLIARCRHQNQFRPFLKISE